MKPTVLRFIVLLGLVLALVALPQLSPLRAQTPAADPSAAQLSADPSELPGVHFVHVASTGNIVSN